MLGWALKRLFFVAALCGLWLYGWSHRAEFMGPQHLPAAPKPGPVAAKGVPNEVRLKADRTGHVFVTAEINGTPTPCVIDTGATVIALSPQRAAAAGIMRSSLNYNARVITANGVAAAAAIELREVRIGQIAITDVVANVSDNVPDTCLLGQSFLQRLRGFEQGDGVFVMKF